MEQKLPKSRGLTLLHHIPEHQDFSTSHYGHFAPDSFQPHPVHCRMGSSTLVGSTPAARPYQPKPLDPCGEDDKSSPTRITAPSRAWQCLDTKNNHWRIYLLTDWGKHHKRIGWKYSHPSISERGWLQDPLISKSKDSQVPCIKWPGICK